MEDATVAAPAAAGNDAAAHFSDVKTAHAH